MNGRMSSVRLIGDRDTVLAFALGGVPGSVVHTSEEARAAIDAAVREVQSDGPATRQPLLLLVTHGTAQRVRDDLDRIMLDPGAPLVLEIPGVGEALGESPVERFVQRVLGVHLK
jgi:vacuolar-type H+-ATPase subunit F/Vma7